MPPFRILDPSAPRGTNPGRRRLPCCSRRARAQQPGLRSPPHLPVDRAPDRKSTRLNSSHGYISYSLFFFNDPAPPEISPLPLHDALPISGFLVALVERELSSQGCEVLPICQSIAL